MGQGTLEQFCPEWPSLSGRRAIGAMPSGSSRPSGTPRAESLQYKAWRQSLGEYAVARGELVGESTGRALNGARKPGEKMPRARAAGCSSLLGKLCGAVCKSGVDRCSLPLRWDVKSTEIITPTAVDNGSRGSSVIIVSDYGLDDRVIEVRSPAGAKDFSSNLCVQTGSEAHPASCTMGTWGPFPGPGRDADHSPASSAEEKNE
jgi:hypothetical protein